MPSQKKVSGIALAIAAAAAFFAMPVGSFAQEGNTTSDETSSSVDTIACYGINSCKGQTACKTTGNQCKGLNSCKGKGMSITESNKSCTDQGGSITQ